MNTSQRTKYGTGREALLTAVVHVVAQKGLRGLTFRAVAEVAGVNNSLVAHHFGTRDALIEATLEWSSTRSIDASQLREFATSADAFSAALMDLLFTDPDLQVFQYEMILESRRKPHLAQPARQLYDRYLAVLIDALRESRFPDLAESQGRYVFAALDGLVLQYLSGVDRATIEAAIRSLWNDLSRAPQPPVSTRIELSFP